MSILFVFEEGRPRVNGGTVSTYFASPRIRCSGPWHDIHSHYPAARLGRARKEFAISAKRLGCFVVACDSYEDAPAMQVADSAEVFSMLDAEKLRAAIDRHRPDYIVPEVEAIRTEVLADVEAQGFTIVPSARATMMTMNRDSIRELAAGALGLRTSRFRFAESLEEVLDAARHTGLPCVVKP
jgi:phosphoribosylglycinamide formyltransferase 2